MVSLNWLKVAIVDLMGLASDMEHFRSKIIMKRLKYSNLRKRQKTSKRRVILIRVKPKIKTLTFY